MSESGESLKHDEPEKYIIPEEIQQWVDDFIVRQNKDDLPMEQFLANREEFDKLSKENPEYLLASLRRSNPDSGDIYKLENDLIYEKRDRQDKADAEQAEKTPVNPENNILTHYEDTLNRMAVIEGQGWKQGQEECGEDKRDSLKAALAFVKKELIFTKKYGKSSGDIMVNGSGGWNRWKVNADGSVEFSEHHATSCNDGRIPSKERTIVKAKLLGFKVF